MPAPQNDARRAALVKGASKAKIKALVNLGLLEEVKAGRENLYINPPLLALLFERPKR